MGPVARRQCLVNGSTVAGSASSALKAVLLALALVLAGHGHAQLVLAGWNFPNNPDNATVDLFTTTPPNSAKVISMVGSANALQFNVAGPLGLPDVCVVCDGCWQTGNGTKWWQIEVNTTGFNNLTISSKQRSSNAGPRDFKIQYRIGAAGVWTDLPGATAIVLDNSVGFTSGTVNVVPLPVACENAPSVFLRWIMTSNACVTCTGNVVTTAGTSRIDDIYVQANSTDHFRTIASGSWHDATIWETSPTGADPWSNTLFTPTHTAKTITIRDTHTATMSAALTTTMDEVTIDVGGTLNYAAGTQNIRNGTGVDLDVNGTFIDASGTSTVWEAGATWRLGGSATYVKSNNTASNPWRDNYQGGIANIAETARWIMRKTSATSPGMTSVGGMVYPNLIIENGLVGNWDATFIPSTFNGNTDKPIILGSLDIGGAGVGTVTFYNNNSNVNPVPVLVDLIVRAGSTLSLGNNSGTWSTGFSVDGNISCNGTITHGTSGTAAQSQRRITLREGNPQTISGSGTFTAYNMTIDKPIDDVTLGMSITVNNVLDLVDGRILNDGTAHVVNLGTTAKVTNASDASFVTGKVRKRGSAAFTFPVGKGSDMQPIGMGPSANPDLETFTQSLGNCTSGCLADGYETDMGTWTVTSTGANGAAANQWYISNSVVTDVVTCNPSLGNATLHIGPSAAGVCATVDCDAVYNDGAANITDLRVESPFINMTGLTASGITFNVQHQGATVADANDRVSLWVFDGSSWVFVINLLGGSTCASYGGPALGAINNVPNARIGFRWQNNGNGARNQKSFAVDNIRITTTAVTESYLAEYIYSDGTQVYNDVVNAPLDHVSICEYWTLVREVGTSPRTVTLSWDDNSCGVTDLADLRVAHWDATASTPSWFDRGNTATTGTIAEGTVTSGPNSLFGPFTLSSISSENPLPITLLSFTGQAMGNDGILQWTTASEKDNAYFELLGSGPDTGVWEEFQPLGRVQGAGTSWSPLDYRFVDDRPDKRGTYYYQLRQVDFDGTSTLSQVISLEFGKGGFADPVVWPNPFSTDATVLVDAATSGTLLVLMRNALGQTQGSTSFAVEQGRFTFQLGDLAPVAQGVYFIELSLGEYRSVIRLVRQ